MQEDAPDLDHIAKLPLVAPCTDIDLSETKPETEEVNTILPAFEALRRGYASWLTWKTDSKFVAIRVEKSSEVISATGLRMFVPTLFTYWFRTIHTS